MTRILYQTNAGTQGTTLGLLDEERSVLYTPAYPQYYNRTVRAPLRESFSEWPRSCMFNADPTTVIEPLADGRYEPWEAGYHSGYWRPYFVSGNVVDGSGNPLHSAVVDLFLTVNDEFVSTTLTDGIGNYSAGTPYIGEQHYVVVNYGPNSLVGTSVDTLIPTESPWG
jgi:hypothetical protein